MCSDTTLLRIRRSVDQLVRSRRVLLSFHHNRRSDSQPTSSRAQGPSSTRERALEEAENGSNMRYLVRFLVFGGITYGGWLYYWANLHCLEYDNYGTCLQRCETWENSTCVRARGQKGELHTPKRAPARASDLLELNP